MNCEHNAFVTQPCPLCAGKARGYAEWRSNKLLDIAAMAMQGMVTAGEVGTTESISTASEWSLDIAEALLAEWQKRTEAK